MGRIRGRPSRIIASAAIEPWLDRPPPNSGPVAASLAA